MNELMNEQQKEVAAAVEKLVAPAILAGVDTACLYGLVVRDPRYGSTYIPTGSISRSAADSRKYEVEESLGYRAVRVVRLQAIAVETVHVETAQEVA